MKHKEIAVRATYSTLNADEILRLIVAEYDIPSPTGCRFWVRGFNDTYKITTISESYALRVYRHNWRSLSEIEYEVNALVYLTTAEYDLAYPIEKCAGRFITTIRAPEGIRYAILTKWAEGLPLDYDVEGNAARFGRSVAQLHNLSAGFQSENTGRQLDLDHLLHGPIQSIKKFISPRDAAVSLFEGYESTLSEMVLAIPYQDLDVGFCHGDFHGYNAHDCDGVITHFDFDFCGHGHRAYDLATYKWSSMLRGKEREWWPEFLAGYREERALSEQDLKLIEPYIAIRDIWLLGVHIENATDMTYGWINNKYIHERLEFLKKFIEDIL